MTAPAPTAPGAVLVAPTGTELVPIIAGGPIQQVATAQAIANLAGGSAGPHNPTATAGPVAVNGTAATFMRSDGAPAVQKASSSVFGIVEVDNTTITASAGVISAVQPAAANPTGVAGPAAVNGSATTYMRSDGAPAVQKGTNAAFGLAEGDGATITLVAGVASTLGATAGPFTSITSITVVKGLITAITGT